jgi:hypothetical protein
MLNKSPQPNVVIASRQRRRSNLATNKNRLLRALRALAMTLLLTACQSAAPSNAAILTDDFSSPDSGWNRQTDDTAYTRYFEGEYQMWMLKPNLTLWTVHDPIVGDAVIQTSARTAGGPDNNFFGVVCRQVNDKNFYFFVISADSYYGIGKFKEGKQILLHSSQLERNDKLKPGRGAHHLRAECIGNTLSWVVDGIKLAQVKDGDYKEGRTGFIIGSYEKQFVDIRFDNLIVSKP